MSKNDSDFVNMLRAKNKTPEDVAAALAVTVRAVYHWIAGDREPRLTIGQVQSLCNLLDCSVHDLPRSFGPMKNAEAGQSFGTEGGDTA